MRSIVLALLGAGYTLAHPYVSPSLTFDNRKSSRTTTAFDPIRSDVLGAIPTLLPVVHAHHDGHHYSHILPKEPGPGASLHYAEESDYDGYGGGAYAVVTPNYKVPSVVLDHIYAIDEVAVADNGHLQINFGDAMAFETSRKHWSELKQFVFVTFTPKCGDFHKKDRCYFLANALSFDESTLTVTALGDAADIGEVTHDLHLAFGSYKDTLASGLHARQDTNTSNSLPVYTGPDTRVENIGHVAPDCTAPADTKYGLRTACNGPYFDEDIDDDLDYGDADAFTWGSFALGTILEPVGNQTSLTAVKRQQKQTLLQRAKETVKESVKGAGNKLVSAGKTIGGAVATGAEFTKNAFLGKPTEREYEFTKIVVPQPKDSGECKKNKDSCTPKGAKAVKAPWDGDSILLKSFGTAPNELDLNKLRAVGRQTLKNQFLNIYCVNCGLSGSVKLKGSITIQVGEGVKDGTLSMEADLKIGVGIGIYAQKFHQETFNTALYTVPLSPFTIGVATIGPFISIGTRTVLTANITGQALARADVRLTKSKYVWDFKAGKTREHNFKPEFDPKFEVEGSIALSAEFGIPVSLDFGIDTFSACSKCKAKIFLETYPYIKASAETAIEGSINKLNGTSFGLKPVNNCSGVSTQISIGNKVSVGFNGFGLAQLSQLLHETEPRVLKSWCLGKKVASTKREEKWLTLPSGLEQRQVAGDSQNSTDFVDLTPYVISDLEYAEEYDENVFLNSYIVIDENDEEDDEDFWYTTLEIPAFGHNGAVLAACDDSNLYIMTSETIRSLPAWVSCSYLWGGFEGIIFEPPNGGVLHYYRDEVNATGVSRLRVSDLYDVPLTAELVNLLSLVDNPSNTTNFTQEYIAAVDLNNNLFYPVACTYKDSNNTRIFVVADPVAGLTMLKSSDIKYSITGGDVDECVLLPLGWGADSQGEWAEYNDTMGAEFEDYYVEIEYDESDFDAEGNWNETLPAGWEDEDVLPEEFYEDIEENV